MTYRVILLPQAIGDIERTISGGELFVLTLRAGEQGPLTPEDLSFETGSG